MNIKYIKLDFCRIELRKETEGDWIRCSYCWLFTWRWGIWNQVLMPSQQDIWMSHLPLYHMILFFYFFLVLLSQKYRNKCSLSFSIIALNDNWFRSEDPGCEWGCVSSSITLGKIPKSHFSSMLTYKLWKLKSSVHRFGYSMKYHKFSSKRLTIYWSSMWWNCPQIHHLHHHHHDYHHHYIIIPSSPPPY